MGLSSLSSKDTERGKRFNVPVFTTDLVRAFQACRAIQIFDGPCSTPIACLRELRVEIACTLQVALDVILRC